MNKVNESRRPQRDKERSNGDLAQQPTTDPKLSDDSKTPGSGMVPDDAGDAPTG
jgi:hypothetical protein